MDRLWAPWRIEYVLSIKNEKGCFLCNKLRENSDEKNHIIARGKYCFVILNIYPYNPGHTMVVPNRHTADINSLFSEEVEELYEFVKRTIFAIDKSMQPDGYNIGMNLGKIAGAGVKDHLHIHIVPRWSADTNFMPIIADTKVIAESNDEVYRQLKKFFSEGSYANL
ncbi:MAG: HIT domain-containing protein [Deltaproteobacteria bacterium]|nr:HIT domain-containing protein [Deltaproteobacteria bacterium]